MGASRPKTLLLVEQDQSRRLRLGTAILREGWRLAMAERGVDALALAERFKPSVILCDLDNAANLEHIATLRADGCAASTIIGVVSHGVDVENPGTIDAILTRPLKPPSLFDTIAELEKQRAATE
jgi:CheY-like chemotaxis protein